MPNNCSGDPGLQIYGAPAPLPHDFKIWRTTFQGNGSDGRILFSCEKMSLLADNGILLDLRCETPQAKVKLPLFTINSHTKTELRQKADVQLTQHLCNIAANLAQ